MKIAITGNIASGKSLAGEVLKAAGAVVFDADIVARGLQVKGAAGYVQIKKAFGT